MSVNTNELTFQNRPPTRRAVALKDLAMLVRVPGRPEQIRAFTAEEAADAQAYADAHGGSIEPLSPSE
jgi:hypothetical protein